MFEATEDNSDLCMADFLQKGIKSPCVARFSTVGGESGSSDTARDPRGFSLKVFTQEGNWDFVSMVLILLNCYLISEIVWSC